MAVTYSYTGTSGEIEIDFTNQLINCDSDITTLEIQEIVDACREAEYSETGLAFPKILNAEGKATVDVDSGTTTAITCILLDSWRVYSEKTSGIFKVLGGNLVQVSGGDTFQPNTLVSEVLINSVAGVIVTINSGSGLSAEEHNKLMGLPDDTLSESERAQLTSLFNYRLPQTSWSDFLPIPSAGTYVSKIVVSVGAAVDAAPTIAVVNAAGASRNINLDSTTMSSAGNGMYVATYTLDTAHAEEYLVATVTMARGGVTISVPLMSIATKNEQRVTALHSKLAVTRSKLTGKPALTAALDEKIEWLYEIASGIVRTENGETVVQTIQNSDGDLIGTRSITGSEGVTQMGAVS